MKKVIVINSFLTKLNEEGEQFARVTFLDPASGKKAFRVFPKEYLPAYPIGAQIEGIEVKVVESEPYHLEGSTEMLNKRTCVIMQGETDMQALANGHGKNAIPEALRIVKAEVKKEDDVKVA